MARKMLERKELQREGERPRDRMNSAYQQRGLLKSFVEQNASEKVTRSRRRKTRKR